MKNILFFSCSGIFRDVPECSGMFHVPGFIDAPSPARLAISYLFSGYLISRFIFTWPLELTVQNKKKDQQICNIISSRVILSPGGAYHLQKLLEILFGR